MGTSPRKKSLPKLDLSRLAKSGVLGVSNRYSGFAAEAASLCLAKKDHPISRPLEVVGHLEGRYQLVRIEITEPILRALGNLKVAAEHGAVAIAFCVIEKLTNFRYARQTAGLGEGYDYWLSEELSDDLGFTGRLEVSGTLDGGDRERKRRVQEKLKQVTPSDHTQVPAFIIVVDFSSLAAQVAKKS